MQEHQEVNGVVPTSLSHIVGQASVVAQVGVALEAAFADGRKMDDCLLVGGPGLGKTQVAKVIAAELASDFHEVLGQSITCPADLNALLLQATDKSVVHIDEAHELKKEFQVGLYRAVEGRKFFLQGGRSGRTPQSLPVADFTLLLSTTDEYGLLQPLRDRMKLVLRFQFYSEEELVILLRQRGRALNWVVAEGVFAHVARRSRGTPRLALRLLQAARRVCRAQGEKMITLGLLERACALEGIDALGLPPRTVSQITEPFLIRAGLVVKDDNGRRQLTALGREHVATCCQQGG
jgi:Holliday junction DNA helicase RuvB